MVIQDKLKQVREENSDMDNPLFLRTLFKDALQDFVLRFVYEHKLFKNLIFTGDTCLKKIYGLPRFSEDLDFDYVENFDMSVFEKEIINYFFRDLQYKKISTKITSNKQTIFLKFPILSDLGMVKNSADQHILFLRCDLAKQTGIYATEVHQLSTKEYSFFVLSYDLPALFANKIVAFLERDYFKSTNQKESFKGRDIFDLVWFLEISAKTGLNFVPNWERVFSKLNIHSKQEVLSRIVSKLQKIQKEDLKYDLLPFIKDKQYIDNLGNIFLEIIKNKGKLIFLD